MPNADFCISVLLLFGLADLLNHSGYLQLQVIKVLFENLIQRKSYGYRVLRGFRNKLIPLPLVRNVGNAMSISFMDEFISSCN